MRIFSFLQIGSARGARAGVCYCDELQTNVVIEQGGTDKGTDAFISLITWLVIRTVSDVSFVSVGAADVSSAIVTFPDGAFAPLKVTVRLEVRCRLKTISERLVPLEKANDCR